MQANTSYIKHQQDYQQVENEDDEYKNVLIKGT